MEHFFNIDRKKNYKQTQNLDLLFTTLNDNKERVTSKLKVLKQES